MSASHTVARTIVDQVLQDAVNDKRRVTLTFETADGWHMFKGEFVSGSPSSRQLRLRALIVEESSRGHLPAAGGNIGITFRVGHKKSMFSGTVAAIEIGKQEATLMVGWPEQIHQFQRRVFERAAPPRDTVVAVRLWREDETESHSEERTIRHGQLEDLSAGGMRVRMANPRDIELGRTYRCAFAPRPGKPAIVLDALARHREAREQGRASLGFQFIGLEASPDGRRALERLAKAVTQFQRAQSRRSPE
jgi:c-di-GMP-binding flagellar brake protein YcgR